MMKNYIYSLTVNKCKVFISDLNLNTEEIKINKEDFNKVSNFIQKNDNENTDDSYLDSNLYKQNYSKLINNKNLLKTKPIFLISKKRKRTNEKNIESTKKDLLKFTKEKFNNNKL